MLEEELRRAKSLNISPSGPTLLHHAEKSSSSSSIRDEYVDSVDLSFPFRREDEMLSPVSSSSASSPVSFTLDQEDDGDDQSNCDHSV